MEIKTVFGPVAVITGKISQRAESYSSRSVFFDRPWRETNTLVVGFEPSVAQSVSMTAKSYPDTPSIRLRSSTMQNQGDQISPIEANGT